MKHSSPREVTARLTRKTESLNKYLQMVGRVLRPVYASGFDPDTKEGRLAAIAAGPKPHAIIIDPVRNWERHGAPNWPRAWTLGRREKNARSSSSDTVPQKICTEGCSQPYEASYKVCPFCGGKTLIRLRSQNRVHCNDCGTWSDWKLRDGQLPLISSSRDKRKNRCKK